MADVKGICRLCGEYKLLSFEHVPPRAAFNHYPRFTAVGKELIAHLYEGGRAPTLIEDRRGAGAYTLCGPCNHRCGRYAMHFVDWAVHWQGALDSNPSASLLTSAPAIFRSRVAKQLVAMLLSASPPGVGGRAPALRRFAYNAEEKLLPDEFRPYVALTRDQDARQFGGAGKANFATGHVSVLTEISFAPFIVVWALGGTPSPDPRLVDISYFASASYKVREATQLTLPVLKLNRHYPGTFE